MKLIDRFVLINEGNGGDFVMNDNGVIRLRGKVYVSDVSGLKKGI